MDLRLDAPILKHDLYSDEQAETRKEHESNTCVRDRREGNQFCKCEP